MSLESRDSIKGEILEALGNLPQLGWLRTLNR
jgi:hypothetical protein